MRAPAATAPDVVYEWLDRQEQVDAIESEWRAVEARVTDRMVFGSWDHLAPWYRHHGPVHGMPLVGVARRAGEVVGIAPLAIRKATLGRVPVRRVESAGHDADAGELLFPAEEPRLLEGLFHSLLDRGGFDVMVLVGLAPGSWRHEALRRVVAARRLRARETPYRYATVDLSQGYDAYHDGLSAKLRGNIRRRLKRAESLGGVSIDRLREPTDEATLRSYVDRMFGIYERSWKADRREPLQNYHRRFYREVTERFNRRGLLDLSILKVGGRDAAFILGYREGAAYYDGTISYDEEFAGVSPGTLLIQDVARLVAGEGVTLLVSHGDREYKKFWVSRWVEQLRVLVFAPGPRAALAEFARFEFPKLVARVRGGSGGKAAKRAETGTAASGEEGSEA
ncbi:MAG TPA: GNAT family N-acetyltransferase [Acidobacteriota bacterium]|nr:GNAT family N-acetyltransferase [Acidobacteriota bacterium]